MFTVKKTQGEVEIGAAPFRCGLIGYHLKLDSFFVLTHGSTSYEKRAYDVAKSSLINMLEFQKVEFMENV